MIIVNVTATETQVTASTVSFPVTVTSDNALFTVTNQVSNFTVTNVTPVIQFSTEGAGFDFATKHRGQWLENTAYTRNDIVLYENSLYICQIVNYEILNSNTPPPSDTNSWELFYWNQWTKQYLTITNWLDVGTDISAGGNLTVDGNGDFGGNLTVDGNGDFGGNLTVNGTSTFIGTTTFTDLTVNNQFIINGLRYPVNKGTYGQVLFTGGDETSLAAWVNLGELQSWSLNEDLYTNGFNIVSGFPGGSPNPQLTIGTGDTANLTSYLRFFQTSGNGNAELVAGTLELITTNLNLEGNVNVTDNLEVDGGVTITGDVSITGDLFGSNSTNPVSIGSGGVRFSDGTVQTTAGGGTGTFTVTQIASALTLGVIRVGSYLQINSSTGVLSVDPDPDWTYTLPAATTAT